MEDTYNSEAALVVIGSWLTVPSLHKDGLAEVQVNE